MKVDLLIKNGLVFDGTPSEPLKADVGVSGNTIAFVHKESKVMADRFINANNLAVAPGFVDTHGHSEFTLLADPRAEGKLYQGITTEINGNCGLSAAPLHGEVLDQREGDLKEFDIHERWSTFEEYFHLLEKGGIALNVATLVGHGNIRASVKGYKDQKVTGSDLEKMCAFLKESIDGGAIGLSSGLIYPPGIYSSTEELIELCKFLSKTNNLPLPLFDPSVSPLTKGGIKKGVGRFGIYTTHMRSEGDKLIESIEETIKIGKEAGIKVHISHIKTSGKENWHKIEDAVKVMEISRNEGTLLTCDRYPYTASSTDLDAILPSWTFSGGKEKELTRLEDSGLRKKIKNQILKKISSKDYWKNIFISSLNSDRNMWMLGKSLHDIGRIKGRRPIDILFDLLVEEDLRVGAIFSSMNEDNLKKFLSLSYCMIGTDSSARCFSGPTFKGKPHPRGFGSFPRFFGKYVREKGLMSMSEGIHKMTMLPAMTFGIHKRGVIKKGAFADLVIFDQEKINDMATFKEPFLKPEGIYYVFVNGLPAVWEGEITEVRAGRILRNGR
jgi:N-acyl-D-amino-acid deacylase